MAAPSPPGPRAGARPARLSPGDAVALVAPAGPVPERLLQAGVRILESWGLRVRLGEHLLDRHERLGYLAGADADRAADLQRAWLDPEVRAVLCAKGGYGAHRMVDLLDWEALAAAPAKIFGGFSDITAVHEAFAVRLGVATMHAPLIATSAFVEDGVTAEGLRRALFEPERAVRLTAPEGSVLVAGRAEGVTFGGCLTVLAENRGTPGALAGCAGGILLLEDVGEDDYRLDRTLTRLLRSGWLADVSGIALGTWHDCAPGPEAVREVLRDRLAPLGVPVLADLGFGHGPRSATVALGVPAVLDTAAASLTMARALR
jgi:muramoyltetrapeptide carboxypeptidase